MFGKNFYYYKVIKQAKENKNEEIVDDTPKIMRIFEGTNVEIIECDGEVLFELYSTGKALGYARWNGKRTSCAPQKDRIDKVVKNGKIACVYQGGKPYLTEEQLYDFMLEAKTEKCKPFRKWVTSEVLPTIRKTGGYIPVQEGTNVEIIECDGEVLFELYSTGMALGYATSPNPKGVIYPNKTRINKVVENGEISICSHGVSKYLE